MLVLKSLTFSGIGRFVESQTINFEQLSSLTQVEGQNNQTNGSSGSGKSTILKAHDWLLGLDGPSTTILQSRLTDDHIKVTGYYDYDGVPIKIERGRKLLIEFPDETITGSSKITEERLDSIIGMPRELFRKILHKRQNEGGFFLDLGPSQTHQFLTKCLNLQKEQVKIEKLDLILADLTKKEVILKSQVESNKSGLEATQSAISSLGEAPANCENPDSLEVLKQKHIEATETHRLVITTLKSQMGEFEKTRPQFITAPYDRSKILQLEEQINDLNLRKLTIEKDESDRQSKVKEKISELQIAISNLNNVELSRQSEVKNKISAIQVEISKIQSSEQTRQNSVRASISALQVESIKNQALVSQGNRAKEEAMELVKELQKIRNSMCPTCEQPWINDAAKAKESQILGKISEHKKTVISGTEAQNKIISINEQLELFKKDLEPQNLQIVEGLNVNITELKKQLAPIVIPEAIELSYKIEYLKSDLKTSVEFIDRRNLLANNLLQISSILDLERKSESEHQFREDQKKQLMIVDWNKSQTLLREQHNSSIHFAMEQVNDAKRALEEAEYRIRAFEEAKARFEESSVKLQKQVELYTTMLFSVNNELSSVQEEIGLATELKLAIKSYLSCSFESALESIGDAATKRIRRLPNMATSTLQLDGLKENKDGKVKEEVNAIISMDGEIGVPVKSLSGGERSSVDLAIDLSVIEFIEETTQKGINIMELDECFTGLDSQNILEALEMLKENNPNKKIILIDHNPLTAQFVENKITVIRDGLTSRIA